MENIETASTNASNNPNEENSPKLEDFLGCCYSNSPPDDEAKVYCSSAAQTQSSSQEEELQDYRTTKNISKMINVNLAPTFNAVHGDMEALENSTNTNNNPMNRPCSLMVQPYGQLIPGGDNGGVYKSWLGQTLPYNSHCGDDQKPVGCGDDQSNGGCGFQSLSLTMSPSSQNGDHHVVGAISPAALQLSADSRKRSVGKAVAKEPVPRKSIDTFGQRTSQYRGVTR